MRQVSWIGLLIAGSFLAVGAHGDGPADNLAEKVRPVPPPGIAVPDVDRSALEGGLGELDRAIGRLAGATRPSPHLPDVQIYQKAIRYALQYNEFFAPIDIVRAKSLLNTGLERARQLENGLTPWLQQPGPTALGYLSRIDGSVQPYGLSIPAGYQAAGAGRYRLDTWFHGRGETLSEVNFINSVHASGGPFARSDFFVLQPYGRYCCANKLAGAVDLDEALADARRRFRIDEDRIVVRGFSMGGAACWQFAGHYASRWCAAAPGAGFSETPEFLKVFQKETLTPTWWEQKLWRMYDMPYYAVNFANVPLVVYSGEVDSQKQAADVMEKALASEGIPMVHIIGPKTGHSYHPDSKVEIDRRIDAIATRGRERAPRRVRIATPTLKYNRQAWVQIDALKAHWEVGRVSAELADDRTVRLRTNGVTAVSLLMDPGHCPLDPLLQPKIVIDEQELDGPPVWSDRSWTAHLERRGTRWSVTSGVSTSAPVKRHDLQGPIDDAFMDSFLMVKPTGKPAISGISAWVEGEFQHAITEWRRQYRGDARVKPDTDVTDADIANHHLILWGDPGSNAVLVRILDRLPIKWDAQTLTAGKRQFPAASHAPVLIFPNPLNPNRYVVLNSGFTFREYDYLNNARQVPKLPDWAVVDITTPPNSRYPGKIADAGFFGERWEWVDAPSATPPPAPPRVKPQVPPKPGGKPVAKPAAKVS